MIPFSIAENLTKLGFFASFLANTLLIYLTIFHAKKLLGTYKRMIICFALLGVLFSGMEVIGKPFCHSYKNFLLFFSTGNSILSVKGYQILILIWAGSYLVICAFIAVMYIYRWLSLCDDPRKKKFDGAGTCLWILYPLTPGIIYTTVLYTFCRPDKYTNNNLRNLLSSEYGFDNVTVVPQLIIQPFSSDGFARKSNICVLTLAVILISFHYAIMLYCGLKMHFNFQEELKKFSVPQRKLQRQFFKALIVQSMGPTIFLVLPAGPILLTPVFASLFSLELSWPSGWLFSLIGLFPPFDSIAFMVIVKEYKKIIRNKFLCWIPGNRKSKQSKLRLDPQELKPQNAVSTAPC